MASPSVHPSAVVDLADSWHRLAGAQQALTEHVSRARDGVAIEALRHETADAFDIAVDTQAEFLTVRITPHPGRAEKLHVWATPDSPGRANGDAGGGRAPRSAAGAGRAG